MKNKVVIKSKSDKKGLSINLNMGKNTREGTKALCYALVEMCVIYNLDESGLLEEIKKEIKKGKQLKK